ncbi:MAG: hypothetical protein KDB64_08655, partial [Solirubrobacterales bacterium]|nr:hypothetical protein [Solirubrobacterales bacterium]
MVLVAAGLIGGVLALTTLNTDESAGVPDPNASGVSGETLSTESATSGTTESATSGTTEPVESIPVAVEGPLLGVNLTAYTRDGYGKPSVRKAIETLATLGSTAITLVPTWYMQSSTANTIAPDQEKSPSTESLTKVIGW